MKVKANKTNGERMISHTLEDLQKKHGSIETLRGSVLSKRCHEPESVDDLLIWMSIERDIDISMEDIVIYNKPWILDTLTEKRMVLLRHIILQEPRSIKALAKELGRDYKNVYDDVLALFSSGLIEMVQEGRRKRPIGILKYIKISIY